jgi:hypothetical protein
MTTMTLATTAYDRLADWRRTPAQAMAPERLGAARPTRHCFTASMLRRAVQRGWMVRVERWDVDEEGVGEAVYRVDAEGSTLRFVVLSTVIPERLRTDRVVASSWDVTAALVDGVLDDERMERLRVEVPQQEHGSADLDTLVWTRGNRSARFFDHVVDRLAAGDQPDGELLRCSPYILRSTAYYGNGRFGMATYDRVRTCTPVATPYRAQMLAAWLFREFSCDLAEHVARTRSHRAASLSLAWRRAIGIGNATGLGMVPFVIGHPAVLDRWVAVRETALAAARVTPHDIALRRMPALLQTLNRSAMWLADRTTQPYAPFQDAASLLQEVASLLALSQKMEQAGARPFDELWERAGESVGVEAQEILLGALVDLDDALDAEMDELLFVPDDEPDVDPCATVQSLRTQLARYDWVHELVDQTGSDHWFWYYSADNEEPRRGVRGQDRGCDVEMPVDVPRAVSRLAAAAERHAGSDPVGALLLAEPELRTAAARVQSCAQLPYAEVRDNLLARDFLPLQLQRFQLAMFGACEYVPQSTDWVRVTLMNGTPSARELPVSGPYDHDLFPSLPNRGST